MKIPRLFPLLALSLIFSVAHVFGQKLKPYKARVILIDKTRITGLLHDAEKDAFTILGKDMSRIRLDPQSIKTIKLRRQGNAGKGAWIGAVSGLVLGALTGSVFEGENVLQGSGAYRGGALGAPAGALIGLGIGMKHQKFIIDGDVETYRGLLPEFKKKSSNKDR